MPDPDPKIAWKVGFEVELLAPRGRSRRDLALALAGPGGSVRTFWHAQSEPSEVPGLPIFHNLTAGYEAIDAGGRPLARLVDDLTLQDDLERSAPPQPGWYRIVSDDPRLLRLIARSADPDLPPERALAPLAALFAGRLEAGAGGMVKLVDEVGASVGLAAPLPGERERGCEIVTPPYLAGHGVALDELLSAARGLGFLVPAEAAVHLHFDAGPLTEAGRLRGLVRLWTENAEILRTLLETNPRCRRLGPWPEALLALVEEPGFEARPWSEVQPRLAASNLTKYCDLNLRNLALGTPDKHTVELRVLPGTLRSEPILQAAALFEALLRASTAAVPFAAPRPWSRRAAEALLVRLPLAEDQRRRWLVRAAEIDLRSPRRSAG